MQGDYFQRYFYPMTPIYASGRSYAQGTKCKAEHTLWDLWKGLSGSHHEYIKVSPCWTVRSSVVCNASGLCDEDYDVVCIWILVTALQAAVAA